MYAAAIQTSRQRADRRMQAITDAVPSLAAWLRRDALDKEHWMTAYAPTARFGVVTSNDAESFAATMLPARKMFILGAVRWLIHWANQHYLEVCFRLLCIDVLIKNHCS